jgi:hypothetical protein
MLLSALTMWSPMVSGAQTADKETVQTAIEAWYHVADDSASPPPLPAQPEPLNPYGENTLHVSITGGQEDARTYIALDLGDLPTTFELAEATVKLPISAGGATVNAESARVHVCLSDLPPRSQEGSFEEPPEPDCKNPAPAIYKEKPYPHLLADITDFGVDLAYSGLAIMSSARAKEKGDTWHVTLYGKKNENEDARPITARLIVLPAEDPFADLDFDPNAEFGGTQDFGSTGGTGDFDFSNSTGPSFDSGSAPDIGGAEDPIDAAEPTEAAPELELASEEVESAYTIVWALPLLLLALSFYFGSALTREIVLRRQGS